MNPIRVVLAFGLALAPLLRAELKLPAVIGNHMVLQQKQANPIWGWDAPGTEVTVSFAGILLNPANATSIAAQLTIAL